jgi:hypothetical protein
MGHHLAAGLGDEHLATLTGNVRYELLPAITGLYPKDAHGKLDRGRDVCLRQQLDPHSNLRDAIHECRRPPEPSPRPDS